MTRRARISWLLNTGEPTGRAMMAVRRMAVLADRFDTAGFTLDPPPRMPEGSPLRVLRSARSLPGEARLARSDVIVATSESSVASAVSRARPGTRVVFVLHDDPGFMLGTVRFQRAASHLSHVVVPATVRAADFARAAGIDTDRVSVMDDFVSARESLLSPASGRLALVAGRLDTVGRAAVDAFQQAERAGLTGWQLRLVGSFTPDLDTYVEAAGLRGRVVLAGPSFDIAAHYVEAGVVLALDPNDLNGLSVVEAMAAGVPVLGDARVPWVRRLVRTDHNGVVLHRTDPIAIAEGLIRVAARAPALGTNARGGRGGLLTPAKRDQLHDLFDRIVSEPARKRGNQ